MENAPLIPDDDSEKSSKKSKKESKKLGFMAVEREAPAKDKPEKTAEKKPIIPEAKPAPESEAPLEKASKAETAEVINPLLVEILEQLDEDKEADPVTDPPVEKFRELIKDGEEIDTAYEEIMTDLGFESSEIAEIEAEPEDVETEPRPAFEIEIPKLNDFEGDEMLVDLSDESQPAPEEPKPLPSTAHISPATPEKPEEVWERRQASPAAMALFGGIIGYLVGRRRGRIKTEKKLLPVQKKLEKQVNNLQLDIQEKEKTIRKVTAEKVKQAGPTVVEVFKQPIIQDHESTPDDRRKAPEAQLLHAPEHAHEHIGKVIVTAESNPFEQKVERSHINQEKPKEFLEPLPPNLTEKRIETISHAELLNISEKIVVGESSLRKIYETHLIGEKGLRRLVNVYMRGGDIQKALRHEIVEHEIDFERDPAMRDISPGSSGPQQNASQPTLEQMLKFATEKVGGNAQDNLYYEKDREGQVKNSKSSAQRHKAVDYSLTATIVTLLGLVLYLALFR